MYRFSIVIFAVLLSGCNLGIGPSQSDRPPAPTDVPPPTNVERPKSIPKPHEVFNELKQDVQLKTSDRACPLNVTLSSEMQRIADLMADLLALSRKAIGLQTLDRCLLREGKSGQTVPAFILTECARCSARLGVFPAAERAQVVKEALLGSERQQEETIVKIARLNAELATLASEQSESLYEQDLRIQTRDAEADLDKAYYEKWRARFTTLKKETPAYECQFTPEEAPSEELNILFLGRTGVGISPTVNVVYNHLMNNSLAKRDIIVPLRTRNHGDLQVTVDAFKDYQVELHPLRGPQTDKVSKYSFAYGSRSVTLIDTPGIRRNGKLTDSDILQMIAKAIEGVPVHAVAVVVSSQELQNSYTHVQALGPIKRLLPRSYLTKTVGMLNDCGECREKNAYAEMFSSAFNVEELPLYVIDSSGMFLTAEDDDEDRARVEKLWKLGAKEMARLVSDLSR